eukprot:scaffold34662_cov64-Phaeocystis_antarctica.AAC.2
MRDVEAVWFTSVALRYVAKNAALVFGSDVAYEAPSGVYGASEDICVRKMANMFNTCQNVSSNLKAGCTRGGCNDESLGTSVLQSGGGGELPVFEVRRSRGGQAPGHAAHDHTASPHPIATTHRHDPSPQRWRLRPGHGRSSVTHRPWRVDRSRAGP